MDADSEPCDLQLLELQMQTADMKSQLDILLNAIERMEAEAEASSADSQILPPQDPKALQIWQAAGLVGPATFAEVASAVEAWSFQDADNMRLVLEKGWLTLIYSLIEESICSLPHEN
jgi:hypothetical protein